MTEYTGVDRYGTAYMLLECWGISEIFTALYSNEYLESHPDLSKRRELTKTRILAGHVPTALLARVNELISQWQSIDLPATATRTTRPDVWGQRLNISDWLAQSPTPFRRRRHARTESAPISLYVSVTQCWGTRESDYAMRGALIATLILQLQRVRPVRLVLFDENDGQDRSTYTYRPVYQTVVIPTENLPLGQLIALVTNEYVGRAWMYATTAHYGGHCAWPADKFRNPSTYALAQRDRLRMSDDDVIFNNLDLNQSPTDWLTQQLNTILAED